MAGDVTPERLSEIEFSARHYASYYPEPAADQLAVCSALRAAWAERDAVAEEAAALREAAQQVRPAADGRCGYCLEYTDPRMEDLLRALATPPTAHAKLAALRQQVCGAARELCFNDTAPDMTGVYLRQPNLRGARLRLDALWAACDALAEAERARRGVT